MSWEDWTNYKPSLIQIIWWLSDTIFFLKTENQSLFHKYKSFSYVRAKFYQLNLYLYIQVQCKEPFVFVPKWFQSEITKTTEEKNPDCS